MKDKEIHDSFEDATAWYIAQQMHKEVSITGGEPLLVLPRVIMFTQILRYFNPDVKLWLYTNGELLTLEMVHLLNACGINGLNVSLHNWDKINITLLEWIHVHDMKVRFLVGRHEVNHEMVEIANKFEIPMRVWKIDDCKDMPFESRYRLKDPEMRWS
jgi:MoaA/NifB/PqqE/SkfB family radical SAM enzyme